MNEMNFFRTLRQAYLLLVLLFVIVVVSLCAFIIIDFKAAKREMFLCAALIKQMESTNQAERKSITKSLAFAAASHDIRNGFGIITCLINHCLNEASPDSETASNLQLINNETTSLLGMSYKCYISIFFIFPSHEQVLMGKMKAFYTSLNLTIIIFKILKHFENINKTPTEL